MSFEHIILVYIIPVLIWVAVISVTLRLLVKKQAVSATLSWLMIIYLVPLIGVIAYLIFGEIKLGTRRAKVFQSLNLNIHNGFSSCLGKKIWLRIPRILVIVLYLN